MKKGKWVAEWKEFAEERYGHYHRGPMAYELLGWKSVEKMSPVEYLCVQQQLVAEEDEILLAMGDTRHYSIPLVLREYYYQQHGIRY